ncbi:MAG: DUF3047 domain-containing protein [Candidatus Omnitrophica bacterium]|nr:DUF3047 domain-containing protein [Candidatus Omnitrophota bacterium]
MQKKKIFIILFFVIFGLTCWVYAYQLPKWFPFNKENALKEWQEKIFKNKVLYTVEATQDGGYLQAKSNNACSGLIYKIKFWPKKNPMLSWKWKVTKFPDKENNNKGGSWIEKDDYAGRVYVIFPSWYFMHTETIEYVWDQDLPVETVITSPYFDKIKLIVVQSGKNNMSEWVFEERNIYQDYEKAFGRAPTSRVGAIALMTDTDNTLSTAEALYKDIKVGYKNEK